MRFSQYSTKTTRYQLVAQLKGHKDTIQSLSITPKGNLLASGGEVTTSTFTYITLIYFKVPMVFVYGT